MRSFGVPFYLSPGVFLKRGTDYSLLSRYDDVILDCFSVICGKLSRLPLPWPSSRALLIVFWFWMTGIWFLISALPVTALTFLLSSEFRKFFEPRLLSIESRFFFSSTFSCDRSTCEYFSMIMSSSWSEDAEMNSWIGNFKPFFNFLPYLTL